MLDLLAALHSRRLAEQRPITCRFFQSWSKGVGANLLASNEGMGLMHTGSGIYSQGTQLAGAWQPEEAHDRALLIATVPLLDKPSPLLVGNTASKAGWGAGPLSAAEPAYTLVTVAADGSSKTVRVDSKCGFSCSFSYTTAKNGSANAAETFALIAVNGSWISSRAGGLPARGCAFYRVPPSSLNASKGAAGWRPWGGGGRGKNGLPLYRTPLPNTVAADLAGEVVFTNLRITGDFVDGDVIRPMLGGTDGRALGHAIDVAADRKGFDSKPGEPVAQAMILVNTHESAAAGPRAQ